ncbi:MAG: NAD(P)H-dependent glycerol-3-phosphate dehydrogenase [Thiobacillaceae bacterium]
MKIAVLGAGAWGTALAVQWARQHDVCLWGRNTAHIHAMQASGENSRYLPAITLPENLALTDSFTNALDQAGLVVLAVPTNSLRITAQSLAQHAPATPLLWVCKGFETGTHKLPHQVISDSLPRLTQTGVLSGPSFAEEVAQGHPTALTLASRDLAFAHSMAETLSGSRMRIYASDDLIGVEIGGAVKNIIAIAAGICDGLALGHNARAALVTRGLAEMTRLGVQLGGRFETFMGLSGLGDLILTTTGDLSRNRQVGLRLARGQSLDTILNDLGHVAEGVASAREVSTRATELGIDMPITRGVCQMLFDGLPAAEAVNALLNREIKAEF